MSLQSMFFSAREYLSPVLRESKFQEHGRITPEEFVAAGDFLVYKFPTWSWQAGDKSRAKDYLPPDKQYLISRNVPCLRRVSTMVYTDADEDAEHMIKASGDEANSGDKDEEDWVATHTNRAPNTNMPNSTSMPSMDEIPDVSDEQADLLAQQAAGISLQADNSATDVPDMDDIPDMDDDIGGGGIKEVEDPATQAAEAQAQSQAISAFAGSSSANLVNLRTYDCLITYDKYYQTPRMWLSGYDEAKKPLAPSLVFQDISSDYAQKTVTVEAFPNLSNVQMATVHPCKHANVMKKVIDRVNAGIAEAQTDDSTASADRKKGWGFTGAVRKAAGLGSSKRSEKEPSEGDEAPSGLRVDQYLLIFLKFMSSIMPTIEVDSTASF